MSGMRNKVQVNYRGHRTGSWAHLGGQGNPSQRKVGSEAYQPDLGQGEWRPAGKGGRAQEVFKGSDGIPGEEHSTLQDLNQGQYGRYAEGGQGWDGLKPGH